MTAKILDRKLRSDLTQERLKYLLKYCPKTGIFTRRVVLNTTGKVGDFSGSINSDGYYRMKVDSYEYLAHRLVFLYEFGGFPPELVDHINGDKLDNRLANLREVTKRENQQNRKSHREGRLVGTTFCRRNGNWQSSISFSGKSKHLGTFTSELEAHIAYKNADISL